MAEDNNKKGDMSVREAGQKGGRTVSEKYDREHFQDIGRKGGQNKNSGAPRENEDRERGM